MFLFGVLVHRLIIVPGLDKPHLVVVFATMGLSILMQNVALMMFSADLFDVPPLLGGRSFTIGPFYAKPELLIGFAVAVACTLGAAFHAEGDLSRQGDPRHRAGRRSGAAHGHPGPPHLPHHLRRRLRAGRARRLHDDAAVLGVPDGRARTSC